MKVQVVITNTSKAAANCRTIDATVGPTDTVLNVQELVASMTKTFSFPDQKLLMKGIVLPSSHRLSDCGIKDGDVLEFQFQASEQTIIKQLSDLLGNQAMSPTEISLLYSYRYAVSIEDALKTLGYGNGQLHGFMEGQKCFSFQGDCVKLAQACEQPSTCLPSIEEEKANDLLEVRVAVEVQVAGRSPELLLGDDDDEIFLRFEASGTVARAKEIIAATEQMPFPARDLLLGERKLEDEASLADCGVKSGCTLVMLVHASEASLAQQLEELLDKRAALSPSELGLHYCQRFGTPVSQALRTLGLHTNLARFLQAHPRFSVTGGCVTLAVRPELTTPLHQEK